MLSFFHLLTHALFKALLFLCAGMIIHSLTNCQDIRFMGGLVTFIPITCVIFNICNFSLCGLPFLSGFYSKDLIVEFISIRYLNIFVYVIFYISVGLTACYRFRLSYYSLTGRFNYLSINFLNERAKTILKSIRGLVFLVLFIGRLLIWVMFPVPYFICLPTYMKFMALILIGFGGWLGYERAKFNLFFTHYSLKFFQIRHFLANMWNMPLLVGLGANFIVLSIGKIYLKRFDQGWREFYGSQNLYYSIKKISQSLQRVSLDSLKINLFLILSLLLYFMYIIFYLNSLLRAQHWRCWGN